MMITNRRLLLRLIILVDQIFVYMYHMKLAIDCSRGS